MNKVLILLVLILLPLQGIAKRNSTVGDLLKKIEAQAKLQKKRSSLPKFRKFKAKPKRQVNLKAVKPPPTAQLYYSENSDELQLAKVTDAAINQLYKLTQRFKNSSKRGELWLRLAEQYVEKSRLLEYSAYNEYDKKMDAYNSGKSKRKPRMDLSKARSYNTKAIQLYKWFERDFPKDEKIPQALFFLGYNYFELGKVKEGQKYYKALTGKYPKSNYVDESNFALGEFYFENDRWREAEKYYRRVVKDRRSRLYAFAMYKLSWSLFKQGQYKNALRTVEMVIKHGRVSKGRKDKSAKGVSSIRLAGEALKDIVVFYAESAPYKAAFDYFENIAGVKSAPELYEKLGFFYMDRGNRSAARYVLSDLINKDPSSPKAFELQYKVVTMYSNAGNEGIFREELFKWIEQYGPGSAWQKANEKNQDLIKKSELLAEATLRNYTLQLHQTAQNSRAKYSQNMAKKGYNLYFTTFDGSNRMDEMRFFYGELLFDMKKFSNASVNYLWIVENSKKSPYFKKALLNSILALERSLPTIAEIKAIVGNNTNPIEFDRAIKKFQKVALEYFEKVPKGKNTIQVKYKLGTLHYYYNQFEPALKIFNDLIREAPKTKYAEYSANLILDIYNLRKDYVGLEKAADKLLAYPGLNKTGLANQIRAVKQRSAFKQAEQLEKGKKYVEAGRTYEAFTLKNSKSALNTSARYNAGLNYEKGGLLIKALQMYKMVVASGGSKNAKLRKNSRRYLAQMYEKIGMYPEAASEFEKYAKDFPKEKISIDYLFNAAVIRDGMQFYTAALKGYQNYLDKSRKRDRWETLFFMGKIWEKRKNLSRAIAFYEKYMNSPTVNKAGVVEASFTIAKLNERLRRRSKAKEWYQKTIRVYKSFKRMGKPVGVKYAAEATFILIKKTYNELVALRIPRNPSRQARAVKKKLNLLNRLKSELKTVIKFDDADQVVAALTLQGKALVHMANSLYKAPLPKGLDKEQTKIYKAEIDKLASPLMNQAKESFKVAVERGFKLGGYTSWLKQAQAELRKFDPGLYPNNGEKIFYVRRLDTLGL